MALAIATPAMLVAGGVTIDYATYSYLKSRLQAVAESAAIAGAKELTLAQSAPAPATATAAKTTMAMTAAAADAGAGEPQDPIAEVVTHYVESQANSKFGAVSNSSVVDNQNSEVTVKVEQQWQPIFAGLFDGAISPIRAEASAKLLSSTTKVCVLTLDQSASQAILVDFVAKLQAMNCGVYSDSKDRIGIRLAAGSKVTASVICSAGGVWAPLSSASPKPTTDCPILPDPLSGRAPPASGGCDAKDTKIDKGTVYLKPGTYCGGIQISGDAVVIFEEGDFIVEGGPLKISGKANVTGKHAGFYLAGDSAVIDFSGDAMINLTGPRSGAMAGLLFFEDRGAPLNRLHKISAASAEELTGTIYLSRGKLLVDPNGAVAAKSAYTAIVANRFEMNMGPTLVLNSDYSKTDVPVPDGIKGTERVVLSR